MRLIRFARIVSIVLILIAADRAVAQPSARLIGPVYEDFGGMRPQSAPTGLVVGLIQGPPTGMPDLRQVRALMPRSDRERRVCFKATTFDSIYLATATLTAPPGVAGAMPIDDPRFSKHSTQVKTYSDTELTAAFILSADCELLKERTLTFLPASFGGPANIVRVALNTRPATRLSVALETGSGQRFDAVCKALTDRTKAFRYVCDARIDPAAFAGRPGKLVITRKLEGAPERIDDVNVLIAASN